MFSLRRPNINAQRDAIIQLYAQKQRQLQINAYRRKILLQMKLKDQNNTLNMSTDTLNVDLGDFEPIIEQVEAHVEAPVEHVEAPVEQIEAPVKQVEVPVEQVEVPVSEDINENSEEHILEAVDEEPIV